MMADLPYDQFGNRPLIGMGTPQMATNVGSPHHQMALAQLNDWRDWMTACLCDLDVDPYNVPMTVDRIARRWLA
jgi:hypothetical protein